VAVLKRGRSVSHRPVALAAADGELRLICFIRPESAVADLDAGVEDDLLVRGFLEDSAHGMALRAFEFQRANTFVVAHRSLLEDRGLARALSHCCPQVPGVNV
jgi:hypothetical protein